MSRFVTVLAVASLALALLRCGAPSQGGNDGGAGGGSTSTGGGSTSGGGAGGGGGNTGGGTGGGGGAGQDAGCLVIDMVPASRTEYGEYEVDEAGDGGYAHWSAQLDSPSSQPSNNKYDVITISLYHPLDDVPGFPASSVYDAPSDAECWDCAYFYQGCDDHLDNCQATYFARGGTVNYTAGTLSADAGVFTGSASNLRFEEWNELSDTPVFNGRCVQVNSVQFNASWP